MFDLHEAASRSTAFSFSPPGQGKRESCAEQEEERQQLQVTQGKFWMELRKKEKFYSEGSSAPEHFAHSFGIANFSWSQHLTGQGPEKPDLTLKSAVLWIKSRIRWPCKVHPYLNHCMNLTCDLWFRLSHSAASSGTKASSDPNGPSILGFPTAQKKLFKVVALHHSALAEVSPK